MPDASVEIALAPDQKILKAEAIASFHSPYRQDFARTLKPP